MYRYNTVLDHDNWSEDIDTLLVCKINNAHNSKMIGDNSENHARQLLIRHLSKKYKENKMLLTLTVFINKTPFIRCAKALDFLKNKNKKLKLFTCYVTNLYHIKQNSSLKASHFEWINSFPKKSYKANSGCVL